MKTLVIAEHDNNKLASSVANAVDAATRLGGEIELLVAGATGADVVSQAQALTGVTRVLVADGGTYADQQAESEGRGHEPGRVHGTRLGRSIGPDAAGFNDLLGPSGEVQASDTVR